MIRARVGFDRLADEAVQPGAASVQGDESRPQQGPGVLVGGCLQRLEEGRALLDEEIAGSRQVPEPPLHRRGFRRRKRPLLFGEVADDRGIDGIGLCADAFGKGVPADPLGREKGHPDRDLPQPVGERLPVDSGVFGAKHGLGALRACLADPPGHLSDGLGGVRDGAFEDGAGVDGEGLLGDVDADVERSWSGLLAGLS